MDLIDFREYCLAFDGVTEKTPFGKFAKRYDSILAFYVLDHMFCFIDMDNFTYVNVKSTPVAIEEIRMNYNSVSKPINQSLRHWIQLDFNGDIPDKTIYAWVAESYGLVKAKYAGKRKKVTGI